MSPRPEPSTKDPSGRLRATAPAFTPNPTDDRPVQPVDDDKENSSLYSDIPPASVVGETLGDNVVQILNCALCTSIGYLLFCCEKPQNTDPCPSCTEIQQLFTRKDAQHQGEMTTLYAKLAQLEKETPEEKSSRLCAERNTEIEALKRRVEKMYKDAELVKAEIKDKEKALRKLEMEIKKLEPAAEFMIKEEKKKEKRK